ncbi:hypothetical protein A2442_00275 [Candidatus Campbellbacteria bacterium RIFOXYC2_FULL_35_25]|uniref:Peptidase C39-like domain-containing protein n=1 Tax=Candidatus Campbellbacteria bacterium RIFOXYC2_FULL_35_25 TaxID=1797582 RepID=A0A1F5EI19_9BACT|nr:MAG: hypothetical protein A2442_00275 [Candidatus Campbellbacteria bacterium RIFOXYC2_FULL_35_25]
MIKKLDIPYYSQYDDVKDEHWKPRACGAVCLKMVLDFMKPSETSVSDFVLSANERGAFGEYGWIHQELINVAKNFGVSLERKEFKSEDKIKSEKLLEQGIEEIISSLRGDKPVLISTIRKWTEEKKFHTVVLTGFKEDEQELKGFYYNDPDYEGEDPNPSGGQGGENLFVDINTFKKYWRRLAIFVK